MKNLNLTLILIITGMLGCSDKEVIIQKYNNGHKKVTYEILQGTNDNPIDFKYKAYYEDGTLMKEGLMKNVKEEGEWRYYFNSGHINSIGKFQDGIRIGKFQRFYEGGEIEQEGQYTNGEITSLTFYYRNGKVKKEPIDVAQFILGKSKTWTPEQKRNISSRCNQVLQFDYKNSNEFCKCIVDSVSKHVEYQTLDTLSDYDKSLIYRVFMKASVCEGLFY